jgi:hypothetical protein
MTSSLRTRAGLTAGAALAAAAVAAAPASAATVNLTRGGDTTLKLNARTAKALQGLGVAVAPIRPAKAGASGVRFPVTGGRIDPATGAGRYTHSGGLRLRGHGTTVRLRNFAINAGIGNQIIVGVGNRRVPAFRISLADARVSRPGFNTTVRNVRVTLSRQGARALNGAFGVDAFRRGLPIGTATVRSRAAEIALRGIDTSLALDPGAAQALGSLGVAVAPVGPARANPDGSIAFPITGGKVAIKTLAGTIPHSGGLSFSAGATTVTVTDFVIDTTGDTPKLTARLGDQRVDLLTLDLSGLQQSASGRRITLGGVVAKLTDGAAAALNGAFGVSAFTGGLTIGTATVRGQAA